MARQNYAAQQAKIEKEIQRLRKQAEMLQQKNRKPIIASIIKSMKEYGISVANITQAMGKRSSAVGAESSSKLTKAPKTSKPRGPAPIKYRHPDTQETWTGRGKPPRWIMSAEASGTPRTQYLV